MNRKTPRRFIAGADAVAIAEQKVSDLKQQIGGYRDLSMRLDLDEPALAPAGSER